MQRGPLLLLELHARVEEKRVLLDSRLALLGILGILARGGGRYLMRDLSSTYGLRLRSSQARSIQTQEVSYRVHSIVKSK